MLALDTAPSAASAQRPALGRPIAHTERAAGALPLREGLDRIDAAIHEWLIASSIAILRISLGSIFLGFGALKLLGVSPAANLVEATTHILFVGLVPARPS
ncbi:MAG TPA: hypothetical protein VIJ51_10370 [Solirubrobacteraceae bacterium]